MLGSDDCGICGKMLDERRVFGLCRECAEQKHAARQTRKMMNRLGLCNCCGASDHVRLECPFYKV